MDEQRNDGVQEEEELERYGVWVKAGPEEVVEAEEDFSFSDLPQDASDRLGAEPAADISDVEVPSDLDDLNFEDLDADLDFEPVAAALDDGPSPDAEPYPSVEESGTDYGQLDDFDDIVVDGASAEPDTPAEAEPTIEDGDDLVSLDDLDIEEPEEEPDPFSGLSEMGEEVVDDELDAMMPGSDEELSDISLEDVNVDGESEFLPELEADGAPETEEDSVSFGDSDAPPDTEYHSFTPEQQGIEIVPRTPTNRLTSDEEEFLDESSDEDAIADLQNDSESDIPDSMDLQERQAFDRIQNELADIKKELADLKAALRAGTAPQVEDIEAPAPSEDVDVALPDDEPSTEEDGSHGSGFFEDEEDETIALTGDELDNILNTAEFTEQAGEAEELDEDFLVEDGVSPATADEIVPSFEDETPDLSIDLDSPTESAVEEVPLPAEPSEDDAPPPDGIDESVALEDPAAEAPSPVATDIEMEPIARQPVVFEGDESAVDELAEMDIDRELVDIEGLTDDSVSEETTVSDDVEIDIDDIASIDTAGVLDENADEEAHNGAMEMDQQALVDEVPYSFDDGVDELTIDDEDIDRVEPDVSESASGGDDHTSDAADDIEEGEVDGFDEFAAAVEEDITAAESGVELDETFDVTEEATPTEAQSSETVDEEDEIEIDLADLDDFDNVDDIDVSLDESAAPDVTLPEEPEVPADSEEIDLTAGIENTGIDVDEDTPDIDLLTEVEDAGIDVDEGTPDIDLAAEIEGEPELIVEAVEEEDGEPTVFVEDESAVVPDEEDLEELDLSAELETPDSVAESAAEDTSIEDTGEEVPPEEGPAEVAAESSIADLPEDLRQEIRSVLSYMDQLLEALPDDKIEEFAQSEHFEVYKRLFEELELET